MFWEITWLGNYLEDSGSLHNNMERTICRHVLPLSLVVSRGRPSLVSHRDLKGNSPAATLLRAAPLHLLAWAPLMLGKVKPGDEVPQQCLCLQGVVLFSQCLMHQGKKKGWKERIQPPNAQRATFHFKIRPRRKQGKRVRYWICNLCIPFMVHNVTLEKSYHLPLTAWRLHHPNNTRPKYRVVNCIVRNQIAPLPFNAAHSDL